VEELATVLGGGVGATRPACDEGWANLEEQMIGQSGKTIRPKVYFGIGISGAMHHLIGVKDSKVIVSVNTDAKAPIAAASDYVLVGDFKQIVPALIDELSAK
jgi:electron transfer flavoprotein alpha subunit